MPFPNDQPGTSQQWYPAGGGAPSYESPYTLAVLPTAAVAYRGVTVLIPGDGTTTADTTYVCLRSATGTYSWKPVVAG